MPDTQMRMILWYMQMPSLLALYPVAPPYLFNPTHNFPVDTPARDSTHVPLCLCQTGKGGVDCCVRAWAWVSGVGKKILSLGQQTNKPRPYMRDAQRTTQ